MKENFLKVSNLNFTIPVYDQYKLSIKSLFKSERNNRFIKNSNSSLDVSIIRDLSFDLKHGDSLGVIGKNGAGKTTLMRLLAGIYRPDSGNVFSNGKIHPMINAGLGADMDATGLDNIYMLGIYLGYRKRETERKIREIIEFCDLGEFINLPIRTYSSGMLSRLIFAVSTCYQPDILIMDEGIGAGDAEFYNKMQNRLNSFLEKAAVLVLASHSTQLMKKFCRLGLVLDQGRNVFFGPINEALSFYEKTY